MFAIANVRYIRDITEAKRAENSLSDSEASSNALFEDAPQGIIVVNDSGVIVRANRHLERLFGYLREELIGGSVEVLIPEALRANHHSLRAGYAKNPVSRIMGAGLRVNGRRKDGSEFPVEIGLSTIDTSEGHLTIAHISDDTLRRESEELQKAIEVRLSDELEAREAELDLADEVAGIITSTLDISQVFAKFAIETKHLVDFDDAIIILVDYDTETLIVNRYLRSGSMENQPQTIWDLKGTQTETVMRTGQTMIRDDITQGAGFSTDGYMAKANLRSTIVTPLVYNDRTIGSLLLASATPKAFGLREQGILERLARQIAPAVENARLYDQAVSRTAELECLVNLAEILGSTSTLEEKISRVLEQIVEVAQGSSAHFRMPDTSGQELILTAPVEALADPMPQRLDRIGEGSLAFETFQQGSPLVVNDYINHPKASPLFSHSEDRSIVFLPIGSGERPVAIVVVVSNEKDHFTPDGVRLLTAIGEGLGTLLENSRLSEELQSSNQEMELADQVAKIITTTLDIEQEYERFALEVKKLVDFDRATLLDVDMTTNRYAIRSSWGLDIPSLRAGRSIPLEGSTLQRTLNSDERILVEGLAPPFKSVAQPSLFKAGLLSHMMVPLIFNDQVTGAITLLSRRSDAFGDREKHIMERLAGQIAPAVENARLFRQAQERTQEIERLHESTNRILDSNPAALVVLRGSDREVVMVNSSFRATFGPEKNQVEGRPIFQVLE